MFELRSQPLGIALEIADVRALILRIKHDADNSDREISEDRCDGPGESTLLSI